jgi:hypothetical protein
MRQDRWDQETQGDSDLDLPEAACPRTFRACPRGRWPFAMRLLTVCIASLALAIAGCGSAPGTSVSPGGGSAAVPSAGAGGSIGGGIPTPGPTSTPANLGTAPPGPNICDVSPIGSSAFVVFSEGQATEFCADAVSGPGLPGDFGTGTPALAGWTWDVQGWLQQSAILSGSSATVYAANGAPSTVFRLCEGQTLGGTYFSIYDSTTDYFAGNSGPTVGQVLCDGVPLS